MMSRPLDEAIDLEARKQAENATVAAKQEQPLVVEGIDERIAREKCARLVQG
jgi:hypothetical protein